MKDAVVIDNGTGYTKMGYAGNEEPQFVIPTMIAHKNKSTTTAPAAATANAMDDFDYYIGDEANEHGKGSFQLASPIRHGQVDDWSLMEAYWHHCFFKYLRCDPEQHALLLTEPPLNAPENREYTAEIMFETFNVPHLYIAVQAVLALAASWMDTQSTVKTETPLTGTVIDSGDGVTHIIPVVDGYAIGSAIKHVPLAGKEVTSFIQQLLRDRPDLQIDPKDSIHLARTIKEKHSYLASDPVKELLLLDKDPSRITKSVPYNNSPSSGNSKSFPIGHERFLGPEVFFNPEFVGMNHAPLPDLVDECIQACPIDCRRSLYRNIVLSGGSTMFTGFADRLQADLKSIVDTRLAYTVRVAASGSIVNATANQDNRPQVNVLTHRNQRYAVWSGGSLFASMDQFPAFCHSKAEYEEHGPSICRQSRVFSSLLV